MPGEHLLQMTDSQFLDFLRKFFHSLTHYFDNGRVRLMALEDIVSPWNKPELSEEKKDAESNESPTFKVNTRFFETNEDENKVITIP